MPLRAARALRTNAGRLNQRRALASIAREDERRERRHEQLMRRRQLSPPAPPTPLNPPASSSNVRAVGGRTAAAVKEPLNDRLARYKRRKQAQKVADRQRLMAEPPFRAGRAAAQFSVFDARSGGVSADVAGGANTRAATRASRNQGSSSVASVRSRCVGRSTTASCPSNTVVAARPGGVLARVRTVPVCVSVTTRRVTRSVTAAAAAAATASCVNDEQQASTQLVTLPTCSHFEPPAGIPSYDLHVTSAKKCEPFVFTAVASPVVFQSQAVVMDTSAVVKETSAVVMETSAVVKETSAVVKETSAVVKETSAVVKETSAVVMDTSAVVMDTSVESPAASAEENTPSSPPLSIEYFRELVSNETVRLTIEADYWDSQQPLPDSLSAEIVGDIRSAQGQARLLMRQRFVQFSGLIDECERCGASEQNVALTTSLTDLQGFWEMIKFQIDDVDAKMSRLRQLKDNGWLFNMNALSLTSAAAAASSQCPPASSRDNTDTVATQASQQSGLKTGRVPKKPVLSAPARRRVAANAGLRAAIAAGRRKLASVSSDDNAATPIDTVSTASAAAASQSPLIVSASDISAVTATTPAPAAAEKHFSAGFFDVRSPPVSPDVLVLSVRRCQQADLRRAAVVGSLSAGRRSRPLCDLSPLVSVSSALKRARNAGTRHDAAVTGSPVLSTVDPNVSSSAEPLGQAHKQGCVRRSSRPLAALLAEDSPMAPPISWRKPSLLPGMSPLTVPHNARAAGVCVAAGDLIKFDDEENDENGAEQQQQEMPAPLLSPPLRRSTRRTTTSLRSHQH